MTRPWAWRKDGISLVWLLVVGSCTACGSVGGGPPPAWEQPPPSVRELPVVPEQALTRAELSNGLQILILEDHRLPRVTLGLDVWRGEASVETERAGLAVFTAELMRRGAGDRNAIELAEAVDRIGADLGAGAGWDSLGVLVSGLSRDLDTLFEILADVVLRPRFDPAELERLRAETLASLESARDDPGTLAGWYTADAVYGAHRFGQPKSGTPESVAGFERREVRDLHASFLIPNAAVFFATGNVNREEILERVEKAFADWKPGALPPEGVAPPALAPPTRRVVIVDKPDLGQARIVVAHEGISRTDPDRIPAAMLNDVLGGSGFSSRLMETLRAEAGLTYTASSHFSLRRQPGPFVVSTFTRVPETRRALDLVLEGLENARVNPPSESELDRARTLSVGSFAMGLETSDAVMDSLVNLELYGLPDDSLETYRDRVRAVSVDDTSRMALRLLHPQRAAIVLVGPADQLLPQVKGLGPVEVVQP
ncbi:insulinase family protein [Myxococcota bacterium]|nr:insulinase family protein [Myxococcota bacterium]